MNAERRQPDPLPGACLRRVRYAPETRQERHHHDRTSLTLVSEGSLEEVVGRAREEAGPLSVVYKPAGTEHANRIGPRGAATIQIEFDPGFLDGRSESVPDGWGWAHGGAPARGFLALFRGWRPGGESDAALERRLFDLLAGLPGVGRSVGAAPAWLIRVAEELDDTFRAPRLVRDLAGDAGVHPVFLARAHRRHFGLSITERIRRRRVAQAASLLSGGEGTLTRVAFETGFADQSHLTRTFRRETGVTPGAYRGLLGA